MNVRIAVPKYDQGIAHLQPILDEPLRRISSLLSVDYGGPIKNLWIDVELSPHQDLRSKPWPLRFQRKVAPSRHLPRGMGESSHDVAHFSIRPKLLGLDVQQVLPNLFAFLYESTEVLERKASKFPGFRATAFREALHQAVTRELSTDQRSREQ